tara:strand:- start:4798 stop:5757 length:960 start_codon:yes stop_codon:yes gene_type:complete
MEDYFSKILLTILSFINIFLTIKYKFIGEKLNIFDKNEFLKTNKKIYLIGGILLIINILFIYFFLNYNAVINYSLIIGSILIFTLGFFDDKLNLNANLKLVITVLIIFFILILDDHLLLLNLKFNFIDFSISTSKFAIPFTILCFALYLNAFNMFDGINLQCGIYSAIIAIYFFIISNNIIFLTLLSFLIPFLYFNFKNKIYLGDSGSLLLGLFFGYFFIKFYNLELIKNVEEVFILMCVPGIDMFRLFCERIYNKKNPFKKDERHIHHILNKKFSPIVTVLLIQGLFLNIIFFYFYINFIFSLIYFLIIYSLIVIKIK